MKMIATPEHAQATRFVKQLLAILCSVDIGWLKIEEFVEHPGGHIEYKLSNRWSVTVFYDCGDWDYIDAVRVPDGQEVSLWDDNLRGYVNNDALLEMVRSFNVDPSIWRVDEVRVQLGYA